MTIYNGVVTSGQRYLYSGTRDNGNGNGKSEYDKVRRGG